MMTHCDTSTLGFINQLSRYIRRCLFYLIVEKNHMFAAFLRFLDDFYTHLHSGSKRLDKIV